MVTIPGQEAKWLFLRSKHGDGCFIGLVEAVDVRQAVQVAMAICPSLKVIPFEIVTYDDVPAHALKDIMELREGNEAGKKVPLCKMWAF